MYPDKVRCESDLIVLAILRRFSFVHCPDLLEIFVALESDIISSLFDGGEEFLYFF
jgi:hypothetical protein